MAIWKSDVSLGDLQELCRNTLVELLGIELIEMTANTLVGRMPVNHRTRQPFGVLHGGASVVLAETLGSFAGNCCVDSARAYCVGMEINANHLRPVSSGMVTGTARPLHLGPQNQVWEVTIVNAKDQLVCVSRLTLAVQRRKPGRGETWPLTSAISDSS